MPIEESTPARLTVEEVRDAYSRLAPLYSPWERLAEGKARGLALELAAVRDGEKVLEIAVGPGAALEILTRGNPGGAVLGTDLTMEMLQRTRRRFQRSALPSPPLCQSDARALPFAERSFDLLVCQYLIDLLSIDDIQTAIAEMRRVLRPSGRLLLVNLSQGSPWFDRVWGALYLLIPKLLGGCRPVRVASWLPEAGWDVREARRVVQLGVPSEVILASPR